MNSKILGTTMAIFLVMGLFLAIAEDGPIDVVHTQVEIGKPVIWQTAVAAEEVPLDGIAELRLSESAENIKVYERETGGEVQIDVQEESGWKRFFTSILK